MSGPYNNTSIFTPGSRRSADVPRELEVQELTCTGDLEKAAGEWMQLWLSSGSTPFQTPGWLIPWWRHLGEGELWTFAFRIPGGGSVRGRLVGLAPLYLYRSTAVAPRQVFPIGIGTTDYLDLIAAPGWENAVAEKLFRILDQRAGRWDECVLPQLRDGSGLVAAEVPDTWQSALQPAEPCPVFHLPGDKKQLAPALPSSMRRNLRAGQRRAGQRWVVHYTAACLDNLEELFSAHLALHAARWEARGEPGVMKRQEVVKVLREAAGNMLPHGLFRLYILYLDSRPAATLYGFVDPPAGRSGERDASRTARTFYYYLGGFDPKFNPVSPGTLLIGHAMEQAAGEGCAVFDFLRGRDRYKYLWGARDSATWCRVLKHGHGDGI